MFWYPATLSECRQPCAGALIQPQIVRKHFLWLARIRAFETANSAVK